MLPDRESNPGPLTSWRDVSVLGNFTTYIHFHFRQFYCPKHGRFFPCYTLIYFPQIIQEETTLFPEKKKDFSG